MTDTLLLGVDGSECGARAATFAGERAKTGSARLIVAYVIEWSPYSFNTPEENEQRHKRREEEIARAESGVLQPLIASLKASGIQAEGIVRHGHAAEVLCDLLCNPERLDQLGNAAQARVRERFLGIDHLRTYAALLEAIDGD